MPIYEYRCASCGHELEVLQKISDAPMRECPACHASALTKKVSAAGFQLKGSGWYVTDFRHSGAKARKDGKAADKANGGETKAEAKSAEGGANETTAATKTSEGGSSTETKSTTTSSAPEKTGS
ncbi:MAG TPA: zinc ribbon domain-containing protein [Casimicrobiaceae bacterium]|nr:zinc ribbon domain-containing protein [Casimicrobiaceae bacterium]